MTVVNSDLPAVLEGTWEEVSRHAEALKGRRVKVILADEPAPTDSEADPTVALLESWLREDATDDPAEIRRAEEELAEFKRNMNAPRREAGERLLYPDAE